MHTIHEAARPPPARPLLTGHAVHVAYATFIPALRSLLPVSCPRRLTTVSYGAFIFCCARFRAIPFSTVRSR